MAAKEETADHWVSVMDGLIGFEIMKLAPSSLLPRSMLQLVITANVGLNLIQDERIPCRWIWKSCNGDFELLF